MSDGLHFQTVEGIVLPAWDTHFGEQIRKNPLVAGRGTYQLAKLYNALSAQPLPLSRKLAVDVGAHVGLWTRVLASKFDRVVAVEPMPEFIHCLRRNTRGHANIEIIPLALGDGSADRIGLRQTPAVATASLCGLNDLPDITVDMAKLDDLHLEGVDFLKIDCEGSEHLVILGGEKTIRRDMPVIVVEHKKKKLDGRGIPRGAPLQLLRSWGAVEMWSNVGDHCFCWPR